MAKDPKVRKGAEVEEDEHELGADLSKQVAEDHLSEDSEYYSDEEVPEELEEMNEGEVCPVCKKEMEECDCPLKGLMAKYRGNKSFDPSALPIGLSGIKKDVLPISKKGSYKKKSK